MLDLSVDTRAIDSTAIRQLTILELKVVAVYHSFAAILEDLEKGSVVIDISRFVELAKGQEILTVDAMIVGVGQSEGLHVKCRLGGFDAATETRLVLIDGNEVDARVLVLPEASKYALHVFTNHPNHHRCYQFRESVDVAAAELTQSGSCSRWYDRNARCL